ncbi:hypothetical protein Ade02nite_20320 [Paractinoplanes deccanensis]|uniref:Uncharacterized protein n=1 Tax=Paractinoplanes deccanensis TaxID=113561 RepID=A0ABQ3Y073_9ACTN|nr:hypothetical protein [Actinoplanes deccanensis]GID73391.1 hypothetical protein Ade02nite_20320 [Actinoplanes deccanensis]
MKRTIDLELIPVGGFVPDEHAVCPFTDCTGAVMSYDLERGELVCPDCRTGALAMAEIAHAERVAL